MTIVEASVWLNRTLGLKGPRTGEIRGSGLVYSAILSTLTGERAGEFLGLRLNSGLLSIDVFRQVHETRVRKLVETIIKSIPRYLHGLLYRAVASTAILGWDLSRVKDEILLSWFYRIAPRIDSMRRNCGLVCLLEELMSRREALASLAYGLKRLASKALVKRLIDPLDYSAIVLYLSTKHEQAARVLAHNLVDFFDSDNILASELSYHVLALLAFRHGRLSEDIADVLGLAAYSPDSIIACRARQLLERQFDAEIIDREYPKPCLVLARHRSKESLYVIE